jgi:hypothetical protein
VEFLEEFSQIKKEEDISEQRHLILLQFLALLAENFGVEIMKNLAQVCGLLKWMLKDEEKETVVLALSLLSALLPSLTIHKEEGVFLMDLISPLEELSQAQDIEVSAIGEQLKRKIKELISKSSEKGGEEEAATKGPTGELSKEQIRTILRDMQDPMLSTRSHAMIQLRRIVLRKDPVALKNREKILSLFDEQLMDSDPFVYLAAVKGLEALGDIFPDKTIPKLIGNFLDTKRMEEMRLKTAEALLQVAKRCGDMLPHYSGHFVGGFLRGLRDPSEAIRASSLSNLAEMCKSLRFALHPYITEILAAVSAVLGTDKEVQVRRGCVFLLSELLRGLGEDSFQVIPQEMKSIYQTLKRIEDTDLDNVTQYHAKIALSYINAIMSRVLSPLIQPL